MGAARQEVLKLEFIICNTLMIGSTVFAQSGQNLWNTYEIQNKVNKKLSSNANIGKYMKLWRFKELRSVVSKIWKILPKKKKVMTGGNLNHVNKSSTIIASTIHTHLIFSSLMRARAHIFQGKSKQIFQHKLF